MSKLIEITGKAISGEWGTDDETGTGIPVLRTTNFTNTGIINYSNVVTRDIKKKNISDKFLCNGDIIIEKSGGSDTQPVGRVVYFEGEDNKYLFNNFTGLLRIKNQNNCFPKYLFYALYSNYQNGGTLPFQNKTTGLHNLKIDDYLNSFEIPLPPLEEQKQIAATLDKVTDLIDKRRKQLEKLDELVKARFVEMFGEPMINSKGYKLDTYGNLFELNAGGTPSKKESKYWDGGTISWIGSNMCQNEIIYKNDGKYITEDGYIHSSARKFPIDTVLIALVGATIGKTALLKFETTTNQNVLGIRKIKETSNNPYFVFYYTQGLYNKFLEIGDGGFSMASKDFVSKLPFPIVPLDLQNQFADFVTQIDKQKSLTKQSLEKLETLKKSLMQEYFG